MTKTIEKIGALELLMQYERTDAPTDKKQRVPWAMYTAHKIADFIGARELSLLHGYSPETLENDMQPNVYRMIANDLLKK